MKNKKLGIALLTLAVFTTARAENEKDHRDVGSSLLLAPALVVDMGVDVVTLDQTHQTRQLLDSKDQKKRSSSKKVSSSKEKSRKTRNQRTEDTAQ